MRWQLAFLVALVGCRPAEQSVPPPNPCTMSPPSIDFGEVVSGQRSASRELVLRNDSDQYRVVEVGVPELPFVFVGRPPESVFINAKSSRLFEVAFQPEDGRLRFGELMITELNTREENGLCNFTVPLQGLGSGRVTLNPPQLLFKVEPGQTETQELMINNSRRTPVTITPRVFFTTNPLGGEPITVDSTPVVVPAFGSTAVRVNAVPATPGVVHGAIGITFDDGTALSSEFVLGAGKPVAEVLPSEVNDWRVRYDPGSTPASISKRRLIVRNVGSSGNVNELALRLGMPALSIEAIQGSPQELFVADFGKLGEGLLQGDSTELVMTLWPLSLGPKEFRLKLLVNEPLDTPLDPQEVIEVMVRANVETMPDCSMKVSPATTLQLTPVNGRLEGSVTFTNTGTTPCIVDDPHLSQIVPGYFILSGKTDQVEIAPGASYVITVAGPTQLTSGRVGLLEHHIFNRDSSLDAVELRAP